MRATHLLRTAALACAAALALTACGGSADPSIGDEDAGAGGAAGGGIAQSPFDTWVLVSGVDVPADARIDLVLTREDDGTISAGGTAACNSYGGTVELGDDRFAFVDGIAVTEMACEDTALMDAEASYLGLLQGVDTWALESPRLVLTGPDVRLVYEPAAMVDGLGDPDSSAVCLEGTAPEDCDDVVVEECSADAPGCDDSAADCEDAVVDCDDTVSSDDPMPDPVIIVAPDAGEREIVDVDATVVDPGPLFIQGAAVDGAELLLFVSVGNPGCVGVASVEVRETATEVVVTVSMGARAGTEGQACTMEAYEVAVPVTLAAPLGDRVLLDGSRSG